MTDRRLTVAAAQLGPIQRAEPREVAVERMVRLMERAHTRGVELVVFPELALTTFFPRHYLERTADADPWFEAAMPSNVTAPLFEAARRYGIGFHLGYAELVTEADETGTVRPRHFNTVDPGQSRRRGAAEIPQGAPAGARRVRSRPQGAASGEAVFRGGQPGFSGDPRADRRLCRA